MWQEAGTQCPDDTREEGTTKQGFFPPTHPTPSAQGLLMLRGHSLLSDSLYPETFLAPSHLWAVLGLRQEESCPCPPGLCTSLSSGAVRGLEISLFLLSPLRFHQRVALGQRHSVIVSHPRTNWTSGSVSLIAHGLGKAKSLGWAKGGGGEAKDGCPAG